MPWVLWKHREGYLVWLWWRQALVVVRERGANLEGFLEKLMFQTEEV